MDSGKNLGAEIRRLREGKGLSQAALAESVGITQGFVSQLETGAKDNFNLSTLYRLCDALGVKADHFRRYVLAADPS